MIGAATEQLVPMVPMLVAVLRCLQLLAARQALFDLDQVGADELARLYEAAAAAILGAGDAPAPAPVAAASPADDARAKDILGG